MAIAPPLPKRSIREWCVLALVWVQPEEIGEADTGRQKCNKSGLTPIPILCHLVNSYASLERVLPRKYRSLRSACRRFWSFCPCYEGTFVLAPGLDSCLV